MLGATLDVRPFLERVAQELLRIDPAEVKALAELMHATYREGRTIFVCGNGGSGSNASHFCEDVGKGTLRREDFDDERVRRVRILSLTDNTPYILAWANDEGFERVFVEQLKNLAGPGDLLIAISGSGNSPNVLRAVEWANAHGMKTVGCTGFAGGTLRALAHHGLHVPLDDMGIVESIHLTAFHWVVDDLHRRIALRGEAPAGVGMSAARFTGEQVLAALDADAEAMPFPVLDNGYYYLAAARLHAFADDRRWALVTEVLAYGNRTGSCDLKLYHSGNCLRGAAGVTNRDFLTTLDIDEALDEESVARERIRPEAEAVVLRGESIPIPRDVRLLAARGVAPADPEWLRPEELLRALVPEHRDRLLATEEELRRRLPAGLPRLLTLDEWRHPDIAGDELPSQTATFRLLAEVLVSGDPNRYRSGEKPNTHWSRWPDGGAL